MVQRPVWWLIVQCRRHRLRTRAAHTTHVQGARSLSHSHMCTPAASLRRQTEAQEAAKAAASRLEELQTKLEAAQSAERSVSSQLRRERASYQKELAEHSAAVEQAQVSVRELKQEKAKSHSHNQELRRKLAAAREAGEEAAREAERASSSATARHAQAAAALQRQVDTLQSQLASAQSALQEAEVRTSAMRREKAAAADAAATASAAAEARESQLLAQVAEAATERQRALQKAANAEKALQVRWRAWLWWWCVVWCPRQATSMWQRGRSRSRVCSFPLPCAHTRLTTLPRTHVRPLAPRTDGEERP